MKTDVVVIGSGISGLTAAALLARKGKGVIVVERAARPGGALKRFKRQGVPFDVGFHYTGCLGEGEILAMLWAYLGVLPHIAVRPFPAHGHDALKIENFEPVVRAYFSYEQFECELKRIFPEESSAISEYFRTIRQVCRLIPFYNTDLELTPFLRGYNSRPQSLLRLLRSLTTDPNLQAVLASPAFLYGVPIPSASFEVHAMVAHGFYSGAYAIDGGGQAIVDAYLKVLKQAGVDVITRHRVESVIVDAEKVAGVITDQGMVIRCEDVIYTGHPAAVPEMLPAAVFRPVYRNRLLGLQNTISMFAVFGVITDEEASRQLDWVNYYYMPKGPMILPETAGPFGRRSLMMSMPGGRDTIRLKENSAGVILLRPGYWEDVDSFRETIKQERSADYLSWKKKMAGGMIADARKYWGHVCDSFLPLTVGTPLTFRDELAVPEGSVYGAQHGISQCNPGVRTRLPGFWLSGQSTLMTGVVGAALAGMVSAGEMIGLEPVWDEVRRCR